MVEQFKSGGHAAGPLVTCFVMVEAGTYYRGQILERKEKEIVYSDGGETLARKEKDSTHKPFDSGSRENPACVFWEGEAEAVIISARRKALVLVLGSEILASALRDAQGQPLICDEETRLALRERAGIIVR